MKANNVADEDKGWDERVSAGKGPGFARSDNHVQGHTENGKIRTNVEAGKKEFSRDSIHSNRKGKRSGKQRKI